MSTLDCKTKLKIFDHEINLIRDQDVKSFVGSCIRELPDYFFSIQASSTGKYHPKFSLGEGGLVRHTKFAVKIADELLSLDMYKAMKPYHSYIIGALLLHDGFKHGLEGGKYSVHDHPIVIQNKILEWGDTDKDSEIAKQIADLVVTHMGQWNEPSAKSKIKTILPKIENKLQAFVHQCDYLASRKFYDEYYGVGNE